MPWQETNAEMERMKFLVAVEEGNEPFAELCRRFGISRQAGYALLKRVETHGLEALKTKPPIASSHPHATPDAIADIIVQLRKLRPSWGPKKLKWKLELQHPGVKFPAPSTIGEVLKRRGLVTPRKRRLRHPPLGTPLSEYSGPNAVWCIDHKGDFALHDRSRCRPLTLLDGYSRYLLKCEAIKSTSEQAAWPHLESAFREYGLPVSIRSDNGVPFAAANTPGHLTRLAVWWLKLGIRIERTEPGHPEQNGRLERLHRTLEEAIEGGPYTIEEQQRRFDVWRGDYNHERPHEALDQQPPASAYETSWRSYPATLSSPEYPIAAHVRRVDPTSARVSWKGHLIRLCPALCGESIYFIEAGEEQWRIQFGTAVISTVDLRSGKPKLSMDASSDDCR